MSENRLSLTVQVPVAATLTVVPEYGPSRPATEADLRSLGWRHQSDIYRRLADLFAKAGLETDEGAAGFVRYFVEYFWLYDHDPDPDDIARFGEMMRSLDAAALEE